MYFINLSESVRESIIYFCGKILILIFFDEKCKQFTFCWWKQTLFAPIASDLTQSRTFTASSVDAIPSDSKFGRSLRKRFSIRFFFQFSSYYFMKKKSE